MKLLHAVHFPNRIGRYRTQDAAVKKAFGILLAQRSEPVHRRIEELIVYYMGTQVCRLLLVRNEICVHYVS